GIGGALIVMAQSPFQPASFATFQGVVWLAIFVTIGVRSNVAALIAGITFVFPDALFQYYLPSLTHPPVILSVLFRLRAISAAKSPDGALAETSRRLRVLLQSMRRARPGDEPPGDLGLPVGVATAASTARMSEQVS